MNELHTDIYDPVSKSDMQTCSINWHTQVIHDDRVEAINIHNIIV